LLLFYLLSQVTALTRCLLRKKLPRFPAADHGNKKAPDFHQALFGKSRLRLTTAAAAASAAIATSTATARAAIAAAAAATTVAAAATAISTTAAAVAAATTAASATATAVAAATTWWASLTWASFVYSQRTTFDGLAIEFSDCLLRVCVRGHRDEGEPARLAGELILHQRDLLDWSSLSEKILEICFGRVEGKISYV
jgi:hypothetical protein